MSQAIENRIVQMEFDNSGFESKVKNTISSLGNLNKSVNDLERIDAGSITSSLTNISDHFSTLGIIGVTALTNITNKLVDMGMNFASSLTIDQVTAGFSKYSETTKDTVAIMNQLGISTGEADNEIEKLRWYSDSTSYSIQAMVSALKKFSAQDIALEDSIPMIMGIGNSLSYAGLAAESASNGFEIYARAIGQGFLSNLNFKSLNSMGAITSGLRKQYIEAAAALGYLNKEGDKYYTKTNKHLEVTAQNFETTLSERWLATDVMKAVLALDYGSYSTELYDYAVQHDKLNASIEETIKEFDTVNPEFSKFAKDAFMAAQNARTMSEAINAVKDAASSSWAVVFKNLFGDAEEATELWSNFSVWLYNTFMTPLLVLADVTSKWKSMGGRNVLIEAFQQLAKALDSLATPIKFAFDEVFGQVTNQQLADKLLATTNKIKDFATNLILSGETIGKLRRVFQGLFAIVDSVRIVFSRFIEAVKPLASGLFGTIGSSILDVAANLGDFLVKIRDYLKEHVSFTTAIAELGSVFEPLKNGIGSIGDLFTKAIDIIKNFLGQLKVEFGKVGSSFQLGDVLEIGGALILFQKLYDLFFSVKGITNFVSTISDAFNELYSVFYSFAADNRATAIQKLAISLLILAGSLLILSSIKTENLAKALAAAAVSLGMLLGAVKFLENSFASKNPGTGISGFFTTLGKSLKKFSSSAIILSVAASMLILAAACKIFATMGWEDLAKAGVALAGISVILWAFLKGIQDLAPKGMLVIISFATAMLILSAACKVFATMDWEQLAKAGVAIGGLTIILGLFMATMSKLNPLALIGVGAAMLIMASSILVLSASLVLLSMVPFEKLAGALGILVASLVIFGVAALLLQAVILPMIGVAAALLIFGVAIGVLAIALGALSLLDVETVAGSLGILAGAIAILGVSGLILGIVSPLMLAFGIALIAVAGGLAALSISLGMLSMIPIESLASGIDAAAQAILVFGGISAVLGIVSPLILAFGIALSVCAGAVALFSIGISALSGVGAVAMAAITAALKLMGFEIGQVTLHLGEILIVLTGFMTELGLVAIESAALDIALAALILTASGAAIAIAALSLSFVGLGSTINSIAESVGKIPEKVNQSETAIKKFVESAKDALSGLKKEFKNVGKDCGQGFIDGLKDKQSATATAAYNLGQEAIKSLKKSLDSHSPSKEFAQIGKFADEGFALGIEQYSKYANEAVYDMGTDTTHTLQKTLLDVSKYIEDGIDSQPTITPVLDLSQIQNGSKYLDGMLNNTALGASLSSTISVGTYDPNAELVAELSNIKAELSDIKTTAAIDPTLLADSIKSALSDMGVYLNKDKVGNIITKYQTNIKRAGGI